MRIKMIINSSTELKYERDGITQLKWDVQSFVNHSRVPCGISEILRAFPLVSRHELVDVLIALEAERILAIEISHDSHRRTALVAGQRNGSAAHID
jgi:hypothetical protein